MSDLVQEKLDIVGRYSGVTTVNSRKDNLAPEVSDASGKVDLEPLVSATFPLDESIPASGRAASGVPGDVKLGKSSSRSARRRRSWQNRSKISNTV